MSDVAASREKELLRLARVLGVNRERLAALEQAEVSGLSELRAAVADRLLERNRDAFERAIRLADRLPAPLAAKLAQHAMGPVLAGRAAALLPPAKAAELARRLPPEFLAEVACNVDLRRIGPLVSAIDVQTIAAAGAHLADRREWLVLASFAGALSEEALAATVAMLDGEALLCTGALLEDRADLEILIALLPDERLDDVLAAGSRDSSRQDLLTIAGSLSSEQAGRVAAAAHRLPAARRRALPDLGSRRR